MRNFFLAFILVTVGFIGCHRNSDNSRKKTDSVMAANISGESNKLKLQIYYFHPTHRCPTCTSIESNIKKVLESEFKSEVSSGVIGFKLLCVDDGSCEKLSEKYQASGVSLHLVKFKEGKESDNDLTEYAFMNSLYKPNVFMKTLQDTINYLIR